MPSQTITPPVASGDRVDIESRIKMRQDLPTDKTARARQ